MLWLSILGDEFLKLLLPNAVGLLPRLLATLALTLPVTVQRNPPLEVPNS
jgi:hypothetical protein